MTEKKKVIGRPFQKGQSGNPSGRPKVNQEIREYARQHDREAIDFLVGVLRDEDEKTELRRAAANDLLDRGHGKPSQSVNADVNGNVKIQVIEFPDDTDSE